MRRTKIISYYTLFAILVSGAALISAFTAQYQFQIIPCELCIYQRIPYTFILIFAPLGWIFRGDKKIAFTMLSLITLMFLINVALAFYHVGVEQHWWASHAGCDAPFASSVEDLRAQLYAKKVTRCDEVAWSFMGVSFATYNTILSLLMGLLGTFTWIKDRRHGRQSENTKY